jgi:hypothetical protein
MFKKVYLPFSELSYCPKIVQKFVLFKNGLSGSDLRICDTGIFRLHWSESRLEPKICNVAKFC